MSQQYEETWFDQLMKVMPSMVSLASQYKLGQDRITADDQRLTKQLRHQEMLANINLKNELERDRRNKAFQLDKFQMEKDFQLGLQDRSDERYELSEAALLEKLGQQIEANRDAITQQGKEARKTLEQKQEFEKIYGVTKKDFLDYQKSYSDKELRKLPSAGFSTQEKIILGESDDLMVDERRMLEAFKNPKFQQTLKEDVGRFAGAKEGEIGYEDRLDLIARLTDLRKAFSAEAFTEDQSWYNPFDVLGMGPSGESTEAAGVVRQIDGLLSRLSLDRKK